MRIKLSDGQRTVDIYIPPGDIPTPLADAEGTALRLLAALADLPAEPATEAQPFGFALSADTERAEQLDDVDVDRRS